MIKHHRWASVSKASLFVKYALPICFTAVFLFLLWKQIHMLDGAHVWLALSSVKPINWAFAAVATGLSFWAVGRYDAVVHRHIGTSVGSKAAQQSGMAAIAVAQTLGFGVVTGAIARWRMLPDLSLWAATKVSAMVALTFLLGLGIVIGVTTLLLPVAGASLIRDLLRFVVLPALLISLMVITLRPSFKLFGRRVHLPPLRALLSITLLTALDTLAAAAALWMLLPLGVDLPFHALFPAFLLALAAGLMSGTPGGVGPFEIVLLTLLSSVDQTALVAAICAFRVVYYAIPALLGIMAIAFLKCDRGREARVLLEPYSPHLRALLHRAGSEHGVLRQGEARLLSGPFPSIQTVHDTGQSLISSGAPLSGNTLHALTSLELAAKSQNLVPAFYKCNARMAQTARKQGWKAIAIAEEAVVQTAKFDISSPQGRTLRRKLRKSEKAGVSIKAATTQLPLAQMAEISARWSAQTGGERGFSMGRFDPDYVADQRVFLAFQGDVLIGFISFHFAKLDWTLDLIRFLPNAPDGTVHALVTASLRAAQIEEIPVVSLAAAPVMPTGATSIERYLRRWMQQRAGGPGLRQFKNGFNPVWHRRYMCAPTRFDLFLTGLDIARAIHFAKPLPERPRPPSLPVSSQFHDDYDEYELAPLPRA